MELLVAYDLSDDRRRNRMARYLLEKGPRLQYSVFRADVAGDEMQSFLDRVGEIAGDAGRVAVFRLCPRCVRAVLFIGDAVEDDPLVF